MSKERRRPPVCSNVNSHYMGGFAESYQETREKSDEVNDFVDNCDKHRHQEIQIFENPDQVDYLDKAEDYAKCPYYFDGVFHRLISYVKKPAPGEQEDTKDLEVIPEVIEILLFLNLDLNELIDEEQELNDHANSLVNIEISILYPLPRL